jgi:hypothetical protein
MSHADTTVPTPGDLTVSDWRGIQQKVAFVGGQAASYTSTNAVEKYVITTSDPSSYTYIATSGGVGDITKIDGQVPFVVENTISNSASPTVSKFFRIRGTNPPTTLAIQAGSFAMSTNGTLTFTVGVPVNTLPPAPSILSITRAGALVNVLITSTNTANYRLRYTNSAGLNASVSNWIALPSIPGAGATTTLQDTFTTTNRFYRVEAF